MFKIHQGSLSYFSSMGGGGGGGNPRSRLVQAASTLGAGMLFLSGNLKYVLGALKLGKLATLGSMLMTVGTYSMFFGLPYAVGMVGLMLVHESGHALAMLHYKIPFSPMFFIPFVGAAIVQNARPKDAWQDAMVALGGPVVGSLGAVGCTLAGHATDSQLLYALADFGYMINLFNLMPIGMLDGGRIAASLSPYAGVAGLGLGGFLVWEGYIHNPIMYLVLLAGGWETFQRFRYPELLPPNYYAIGTTKRVVLTGSYFGLIGALFMATAYNDQYRRSPEELQRGRYGYYY